MLVLSLKGIDWKEEKLSSQTTSMIYRLPVQPLQLLHGLAIVANIYSGPYFKINLHLPEGTDVVVCLERKNIAYTERRHFS